MRPFMSDIPKCDGEHPPPVCGAEGQCWQATPPPPPAFNWNVAHDLLSRGGAERATVLGLSMVSEQLEYLIDRLTDG